MSLWRKMHASRKQWIAGGACLFFKLNKNVGVKLYRTRTERDYAHRLQTKALKHGLAPELGPTFELCFPDFNEGQYATDIKRRTVFGYLTQAADVKESHASNKQEMDVFVDLLAQAGLSCWDIGWMNVGRINGRLVCIDFDMGTHD